MLEPAGDLLRRTAGQFGEGSNHLCSARAPETPTVAYAKDVLEDRTHVYWLAGAEAFDALDAGDETLQQLTYRAFAKLWASAGADTHVPVGAHPVLGQSRTVLQKPSLMALQKGQVTRPAHRARR